MSDTSANALIQLQAHYNALRTSERRIADYILSHPNDIIYQSVTTLAENTKVSETSVIRLCKTIGYNGFQDFKINIAKSIVEPQQQIHEEVKSGDSVQDLIRKVMTSNIKAVEDTMNYLNGEAIRRAIDAIAGAKRLEFYGVGGSGAVAMDAHHKFFKYCPFCAALIDPHMQAMSATTMREGDVAFGISHTGGTKDIVESLSLARDAGATTISLTGGMNSPITHVSDIVLQVVSREQAYKPEPMSSRIAQLSVIDVIAVGVAMTRPDDVLETLSKTRRAISNKRY